MNNRSLNLLNMALMVAALVAAIFIPFQLFLIAYAVLGPLHYLTQISWLHNRGYFVSGRSPAILMIVLAALVIAGSPFAMGSHAIVALVPAGGAIVFSAFALALVLVVTARTGPRLAGAALVLMIATALPGTRVGDVAFSLMLPTLVHVLVFTGLFILLGALRERSPTGAASIAVFVSCAALCLLLDPGAGDAVGDAVRASYPVGDLNCRIVEFLHLAPAQPGARPGTLLYPFASADAVFTHPASWRAARLIAFAYTYHYLNWFSKTRVIGWHEISRSRMACIIVFWLASVAIYAYDFLTGLAWLFLLSLAHVFLEFPLNWRSVAGIANALSGRRSATAASASSSPHSAPQPSVHRAR